MRSLRIIFPSLPMLALLLGCEDLPQVGSIAFSPDGQMVAFTVGRGAGTLFVGRTDGAGAATTVTAIADVAERRISWSADSRWLAYTSDRAGSWDIWAWDTKAKRGTRVTRHPARDHLATFRPRSNAILFLSTRGRQADLWQVGVAGGEPTPITDDADMESDVSVSGDGRVLTYRATDAEGSSKAVVHCRPDGAVASLVPPRSSGMVKVAPDGEKLAFVDGQGLHVADLTREGVGTPKLVVRRAGRRAMTFDWAPDSDALLADNGQCLVRRSLGWFGREKRLTAPQSRDTHPTWHPDGRRFACAANGSTVALASVRAPDTRHWLVHRFYSGHLAAGYEQRRGHRDRALALSRLAMDLLERQETIGDESWWAARELHARLLASQGRADEAIAFCEAKLPGRDTLALIQLAFKRDVAAACAALSKVPEQDRRYPGIGEALAELDGEAMGCFSEALAAELRGDSQGAVQQWLRLASLAADPEGRPGWARRAIDRAMEVCDGSRASLEACRRWLGEWPRQCADAQLAFFVGAQFEERGEFLNARREYARISYACRGELRVKAGLAMTRICRRKRGDPANAIGSADVTLKFARELGPEGQEALLCAWNDQIGLQLSHLSDPDAAYATATELPDLIGEQKEEAGDMTLVNAVHGCVKSFDEARSHELGNRALETLLPLLRDTEGLASFLSRQALHLIKLISPKPFVECKLGHLPMWLDTRVAIVLARLEAVAGLDGSRQLDFALRLLRAWRPADVEKLLRPIATHWEAGSTSEETRHMLSAGYYVLGNFHQTRRDFAQALDYYGKLLNVVRDEGIKGYAAVIAECREFLPRRPHIVRQWLELERSIAHGPWEPVAFISGAVAQTEGEGFSGGDAWRREAARAALAGYKDFLRKHGKTSLADDAELRLIELSLDSRLQALRAERFLAKRPRSRLFPVVLDTYAKASQRQHAPWLAATFLTDLTKKPDYAPHLPVLRATIGNLMPRTR